MVHLVSGTPILRRRAFYQGCLFFAFSLFWTTTPLLLAGPHYGLTQNGIALFALAGVSGAIAAPIAGRVADRGWGRPATGAAIALVALAMLGSIFVPQGSAVALLLLVAAAIAVDFGVQANLVFGYRAIFALAPEVRGRLNGVYLSTAFVGGAIGSALGALACARGVGPGMLCRIESAAHCVHAISHRRRDWERMRRRQRLRRGPLSYASVKVKTQSV
jgi:predicted MFS family arabinose efflux permease